MTESKVQLKLFVASPGGLTDERQYIDDVVATLNLELGDILDVIITPYRYERMVGRAGQPQDQINELVDKCDLLIGLVHRRWGMNTGNGYDSGFHEEFIRASQRRETTGFPEVALFFKEVDAASLVDPGPQLQKVLAFRSEIEATHSIFYNHFRSTDEVKPLIMQLLVKEMHRVGSVGTTGQGYSPQRSGALAEVPGAPIREITDGTEAPDELARTFYAFAASTTNDGSFRSEDTDFDRLQLFASSASRDRDDLPIHLVNRMFRRRNSLSFRQIEANAWFQTYLTDIGRSKYSSERVIPMPSAFRQLAGVKELLEGNFKHIDSPSEHFQNGRLILLRALGLRTQSFWPSSENASGGQDAIDLWATVLGGHFTQDEAILYWLAQSSTDDLWIAEILTESANEMVSKAAHAVISMSGPEKSASQLASLKPSLLLHPQVTISFDDNDPFTSLDTPTLETLAALTYGRSKVRDRALTTLISRDEVPQSLIDRILKADFSLWGDGQSWEEFSKVQLFDRRISAKFWARLVLAATKHTGDAAIDAVSRVLHFNPALDASDLPFVPPTLETLGLAAKPELVNAALCRAGFNTHSKSVATDLINHTFGPANAYIATISGEPSTVNVVEFVKDEFTLVGLRHLISKSDVSIDRLILTKLRGFVHADRLLSRQARPLLKIVGTDEDVEFVLKYITSGFSEHRTADLQVFLQRLGVRRLESLVIEQQSSISALALMELMNRGRRLSNRRLTTLLRSSDSDLRMIALDCLVVENSPQAMTEILDRYYATKKTFYYNVICELDRRIADVPKLHELVNI